MIESLRGLNAFPGSPIADMIEKLAVEYDAQKLPKSHVKGKTCERLTSRSHGPALPEARLIDLRVSHILYFT